MEISDPSDGVQFYQEMLGRFSHMEAGLSAVLSIRNQLVPDEIHILTQQIFDLLAQIAIDIYHNNIEDVRNRTELFLQLFSKWEGKSRSLLVEIGHIKPPGTEIH